MVTTLFLIHIHPTSFYLAVLAVVFAFLSYATNSVNYGLFSACLTTYIVFLLSLNEMPGPVIAHRRAVCTLTGGLIALFIHLDALRRHKKSLNRLDPPIDSPPTGGGQDENRIAGKPPIETDLPNGWRCDRR